MSTEILHYPLAGSPEQGGFVAVADGVYCLRLSLPVQLNHINLWLLADADGWTLIDTGMDVSICRQQWEHFAADLIKDKPLQRIIVTHYHPDHIGLAGYLQAKFNTDLYMTKVTHERAQFLCTGSREDWQEQVASFCRLYDIEAISAYTAFMTGEHYRQVISQLPQKIHYLEHADDIHINGSRWQPIVASGHAEDHLSLYCAQKNMLISGDQVLPDIISNVGIHYNNANDNALQQYLRSLDRIEELPEDVMVLPSHGGVFVGLHKRTAKIRERHENRLAKVWRLCETAKTVTELIPLIHTKKLDALNKTLAFGEILAYLIYLSNDGKLETFLSNETCYFQQR